MDSPNEQIAAWADAVDNVRVRTPSPPPKDKVSPRAKTSGDSFDSSLPPFPSADTDAISIATSVPSTLPPVSEASRALEPDQTGDTLARALEALNQAAEYFYNNMTGPDDKRSDMYEDCTIAAFGIEREIKERAVSKDMKSLPVFFEADIDLGDTLGKGSFGAVVAGKLTRSGLDVAIKRLPSRRKSAAHLVDLELLKEEIKLYHRIRHPNVVMCLGLAMLEDGDVDSNGQPLAKPALVMERLPRSVAQALVEPMAQWTVVERLTVLRDAARGLAYLHAHKPPLIHRDIKPQNILIDLDGTAKLVDFGLVSWGKSDTTAGTMLYMAPEVTLASTDVRGGAIPASDVYALGITAIEIFIRQHFDYASGTSSLMELHHTDHRTPEVPDVVSQVSTGVAGFIGQMLKFLPGERPSALDCAQMFDVFRSETVIPCTEAAGFWRGHGKKVLTWGQFVTGVTERLLDTFEFQADTSSTRELNGIFCALRPLIARAGTVTEERFGDIVGAFLAPSMFRRYGDAKQRDRPWRSFFDGITKTVLSGCFYGYLPREEAEIILEPGSCLVRMGGTARGTLVVSMRKRSPGTGGCTHVKIVKHALTYTVDGEKKAYASPAEAVAAYAQRNHVQIRKHGRALRPVNAVYAAPRRR